MMKIALATKNEGKIREMLAIFDGMDLELLDYRELPPYESPPEEGETFLENALAKAKAAHEATGLPALADDSGLEVEALDWGPGVRSARYGGEDLSDMERSRMLLEEMRDVPEARRSARFRCVMALYPAPQAGDGAFVTEGIFHGSIAFEPAGENGFGYDPVFLVPDRGITLAQMPLEEKNSMSHRYRAGIEMRYLIAGRTRKDLDKTRQTRD